MSKLVTHVSDVAAQNFDGGKTLCGIEYYNERLVIYRRCSNGREIRVIKSGGYDCQRCLAVSLKETGK